MKLAKHVERIVDEVAAFQPEEHSDLTATFGVAHLLGRSYQIEAVAEAVDQGPERGELPSGGVDWLDPAVGSSRPDGQEDCRNAALAQAGKIDVAITLPTPEIPLAGGDALRGVAMGIDKDGLIVQASSTGQQRRMRGR